MSVGNMCEGIPGQARNEGRGVPDRVRHEGEGGNELQMLRRIVTFARYYKGIVTLLQKLI